VARCSDGRPRVSPVPSFETRARKGGPLLERPLARAALFLCGRCQEPKAGSSLWRTFRTCHLWSARSSIAHWPKKHAFRPLNPLARHRHLSSDLPGYGNSLPVKLRTILKPANIKRAGRQFAFTALLSLVTRLSPRFRRFRAGMFRTELKAARSPTLGGPFLFRGNSQSSTGVIIHAGLKGPKSPDSHVARCPPSMGCVEYVQSLPKKGKASSPLGGHVLLA
jgi:hypothetical protein